ncbi:MAG: hypothetical protein ACR2RV_18715 [Verrucomicrobiales bacterium]
MKIRTASSIVSVGGLIGLALIGSSLVLAQDAKNKTASALDTDPFVKQPAGANAIAADPFADSGAGGGVGGGDPFGDSGGGGGGGATASPQAVADDPFAGGGGGGAAADDPFDPFDPGPGANKRRIREVLEPVALLEYIRVDLATANQLLQKFGGLDDVTPLRLRLEEMLEEGGAELVETSFLRSLQGRRMKTGSQHEYIYPTEFNVPSTPQQFEGKQASMPIASVSPSAFDVRSVGTIVEIESMVGLGERGTRHININIAPEIVRYLGDRSMVPGGTAEHRIQVMPDFATMRVNTAVNVREGATSLLGLVKETPDDQKRVLVLLHADTLRSELPEPWEEGDDNSYRVVAHFEWIQLGHRDANKLLNQNYNQRDASAMRASLETMIRGGDAELVESAYLKSLPGQRTKTESVREHMYPTEFNPPELPANLKIEAASVRPAGATPTAIDRRNVGTTVELEAQLDGRTRTAEINVAAEITAHLGDRQLVEDPPEEVANVILPDFYTMELQTNVRCFLGQSNLLGVFTPHGDPGQRVLLFVKVDTVK